MMAMHRDFAHHRELSRITDLAIAVDPRLFLGDVSGHASQDAGL